LSERQPAFELTETQITEKSSAGAGIRDIDVKLMTWQVGEEPATQDAAEEVKQPESQQDAAQTPPADRQDQQPDSAQE